MEFPHHAASEVITEAWTKCMDSGSHPAMRVRARPVDAVTVVVEGTLLLPRQPPEGTKLALRLLEPGYENGGVSCVWTATEVTTRWRELGRCKVDLAHDQAAWPPTAAVAVEALGTETLAVVPVLKTDCTEPRMRKRGLPFPAIVTVSTQLPGYEPNKALSLRFSPDFRVIPDDPQVEPNHSGRQAGEKLVLYAEVPAHEPFEWRAENVVDAKVRCVAEPILR